MFEIVHVLHVVVRRTKRLVVEVFSVYMVPRGIEGMTQGTRGHYG